MCPDHHPCPNSFEEPRWNFGSVNRTPSSGSSYDKQRYLTRNHHHEVLRGLRELTQCLYDAIPLAKANLYERDSRRPPF